MQTKVTALLGVVLLVGVALSASAFTSATVDRTTTIDVTADDSAIIGLSPGAGTSMVTQTNGELTIAMSGQGGQGVNVNSQYIIGDSADPKNASAFNVSNNDGTARDLTFSYAASGTDTDSNANVKFEVFERNSGTTTSKGTFDEHNASSAINFSSGVTYYVVLTVDTAGSSSGDKLGGTLKITAS